MTTQTAVVVRTCRLIYYGPAGTGKRDNLLHIAKSIPAQHRLPVVAGDPEREIAFLLKSGAQGDWQVSVQTVDTANEGQFPGEISLPFDGVVFVAHSASSLLDQTLSSLEALKAFLDRWGRDITSVPLVLQYNMRSSEGCLPVDRLESLINPWGLLSFPANAATGEGARETLKAILSLTISHLIRSSENVGVAAPQASERTPIRPSAPTAPSQMGRPLVAPPSPNEPAAVTDHPAELLSDPTEEDATLNVTSEDRGGIFFEDLRPPIVVPVRIPRKLLEKYGSARIILEVEVDDGNSMMF